MISKLSENCLPTHPACANTYRKLLLTSNQYRVALPEAQKVFVYTLSFAPPIPTDNTKLKKQLIRSSRKEITKYLDEFIHCGENLFSLKDVTQDSLSSLGDEELTNSEVSSSVDSSDGTKELKIACAFGETMYEILVSPSGEVDLSEPSLIKKSTMQIFNISLRHKLKVLKLVQIGCDRNHYDPSGAKRVQGFPACIWPGFFTSINLLRGGLMLTIDCSFKLVRTDSLLEIINEYMNKYGPNCRDHIRNELKDKIVMTSYGSQSMYRIEDVLFDETPEDKFCYGSQEISFAKYFSSRYQAAIRVRNQPLILARRSYRADVIKLIPELCRMTGAGSLQDDFRLKKEIAVHTRMRPEKRQQDIQGLADRLHQITEDHWGMQTSLQPVPVEGLQLPHPSIITGNKKLQVNDKASFRLQDCSSLKPINLERWQLFFTERDQALAQEFTNSLTNISKSFGLQVKPPILCPIPYMKNLEQAYINTLKEKVRKEAQLIILLMPKNIHGLYKAVKTVLTTERPIPSQAVLTSSVEKRDMSVYSKIAVQILCKIGGGPWAVNIPQGINEKTMLVGIDVCHNTFNAKQSVLGFCASLDNNFTKFYSKIAFHNPGQEISSVLSPLFFEALKQYYQSNGKKKPQSIIIYRDGVGTSQYAEVVSKELPQLIVAIREFDPNWKPEIVALVVNKRVNQRFFLNNANPHAGIVVDSSVVWDHYNFYLMSHNVNAGCMTPTHYNIVVNDSQITAKALYELTYNLCYMYYNWQGGIRVPAPCMYAHKIAYLVGKHTGVAFDPRLAPSFFYL